MFRRDNSSKYVSRRSMECGSLSSRKSKRDGTRQSMDEDIWGEDLDDDSLDRCFIMASQAISQQETKETSSMELPGTNIQAKAPTEWSMEQFDEPRAPAPRAHLFTPKRPSAFLSNVSFAASKTDGKEQIHFLPRNFPSGGQSQFPPRNVEAPKKPQPLAGQTRRQFPTSTHTANVVPTKQVGVMPRNVGVSGFPSSRSRQMGTLPFVKKSVDAGPRNIPLGAKHILPGNEVSSLKQPEAVPYILPTQTFPRSDRLLSPKEIGTVPRSAPPIFSEAQIFPKCNVPFKQKECVSIPPTSKQTQIFPKSSRPTSKQQEPVSPAFPSASRQTHSFPKSDDVSKQRDFIPQNVISTSRSMQILPKSGPMSSKHVESLPKSVNASTVPRSVQKLDTVPSLERHEETVPSSKSSCGVMPATGEVTKRMPEAIGLSTTSAMTSTSVFEDLRKQVENLKCVNQALQDNVLTKEGEVKILRSQMKSLKIEVDSQREMKKLEEESELERCRNRVKQLEQELEKKSSLLEFKSMEADNAEERCRLLQSRKLKLVSPQPSQTPSRPSPAQPRISPKPSPVEHQSGQPTKKFPDSRLISPPKSKSFRQEAEKSVKLPVKSAASTVQLLIRQEVEKTAEFLVKHNSAFDKEVLQRHLERRNGIVDDAAKQQLFEKHFGLPLSTFGNNKPATLQLEKCLSANKSPDGTPSPKCISSPSKVQQILLPAKSSSSTSKGRNNPLTLKSFHSSSKMECVPLLAMSALSSSKSRVERISLLRKSINKSLERQKDENKLPFFSKNKISDGSYFRRLISPDIFEPPMGGVERESYLGLLQVPIIIEGDVANLTPYGMTVNVNHAAVVELTRMHSLHDTDAQYLINKIVWQCYSMLVEQESLLRRYSIPTKEETVMKLDYKISMQAGKLVESNASVLSARSWFTLEQGVEIRRALGLLAALALASDYAAEYMAGIIRCNKYVTDVTLPKKCFYKPKPKLKPKADPVEEWSPPVKDDCEIELSQEEQLELSEIRHKCQELRKPWIREREERCEQERLVAEQEHALILNRIGEIEEAHPNENKNEICNVELWYLRNRARCLGILNDEVQERCSRKSNIQQVATSKSGSAEKILKSMKNIAVPIKATFQEPIAGPSNKHDVSDVSSRTISTRNKAKKDSSVQKLTSKRVQINEPAEEIDVIIISDSIDEKSDTVTSKVNEYFKIGKKRQTNNKKLDTKKHKLGKHLADINVRQVSDEISDLEDKQSNYQENKIGDRDIIEDRNKKSKSEKRKVKDHDGKESHLKKRKTNENEISEAGLKKSKTKEGDSGRSSLMGNKIDNSVMNQAGSENGPQTSNRKPSAGETRSRTSSSNMKLDSETDHLKQSKVVEITQLNVGKSGMKTTKIKQTTIVNDPNLFKDDVKSDQKGIGVKRPRIMIGRQFGSTKSAAKTVGSLQQGVKNNLSVLKEKKVEPSKNVNSDDKLFKKPYPVTWPRTVVKSTGVRTIVRRQLPCEDNDTKAFTVRNMRIMKRRRRHYKHLKGRNPMHHPVVRACQKEAQKVIQKRLDKRDGRLKNKLDVPSPHTRTKKKADLLKLLYRIVRHICDKRLTLTFNGILFGVVHLLKAIASRVIFSKDRWPLLQDTVRDVILCRPSVRVIVELMDLLTNLAFYPSVMESLCRDTGPCPYVGGNFGLVFFYDGIPRYDLGYDVGEEKYNRHSCVLNLLCYLVAVQRATIREYVKLGVNMLTWLNYVYTLNNNTGPYWIGPNDNSKQKIRNCQCRPRIIEAFIWLMYLCYRHLEKTGYEKDTLFFEVRHFLANGLQFVLMMIQSDPEVGLYMANVEGEYRDLLMGLSHSLKDIGFTKSDEHTLLLLKVLEDDQDAEHSVKTCSNISKEYLSELCTTINTIISTLFYRFTHTSNQASQIAGSSKDHQ